MSALPGSLLEAARLLPVGQIKWKTTQQGVSQWPGQHRQQTSQSNHQPIWLNTINVGGCRYVVSEGGEGPLCEPRVSGHWG